MNQKYFPGTSRYFLLDSDSSIQLENAEITLAEKRNKFRIEVLNELVCRLSCSNHKILLILDVLDRHDEEKRKILRAEVTLQAQILHDALSANLLEIAELVAFLIKQLRGTWPSNYGELFGRIGKDKLKNILNDNEKESYIIARCFLFPGLTEEQSNVPKEKFNQLAEELEQRHAKLNAFRDKVLAHKSDPDRFGVHLAHEEYFDIYNHVINILDAIAIVATFTKNSSYYSTDKEVEQTKAWLADGLTNSLKRLLE